MVRAEPAPLAALAAAVALAPVRTFSMAPATAASSAAAVRSRTAATAASSGRCVITERRLVRDHIGEECVQGRLAAVLREDGNTALFDLSHGALCCG